MIENYKSSIEGVIKQINVKPFEYDSEYLDHYSGDSLFEKNSLILHSLRLQFIINSLSRIPQSILDIGCGNGKFLELALKAIPECSGYDIIDIPFKQNIQKETKLLTGKYYDVISFWDSLEHFENIDFVEALNCRIIVISLPWCHYNNISFKHGTEAANKWFKDEFFHRKPDEHIWHFDEFSLETFFARRGFKKILGPINFEDIIRKRIYPSYPNLPNILSMSFRKL